MHQRVCLAWHQTLCEFSLCNCKRKKKREKVAYQDFHKPAFGGEDPNSPILKNKEQLQRLPIKTRGHPTWAITTREVPTSIIKISGYAAKLQDLVQNQN
ncbi:hypothetical protein Csa_006872 [Cucumis sativus]|uniref:Uncharacterized protein n=1 Tax=Cucumis sativus TaxID=3659 RepID=A0A0A0LYD0_CUCSA|nr:hypothetical protein Csa_006872 [Cucumis sativus]